MDPGHRVDAIVAELGLVDTPVRYDVGSVPVFRVGGRVLKLFPPDEATYLRTEAAVLERLHGRLPVPTPEPVATGHADGWHYLLMSRLSGAPLDTVWDDVAPGERVALMHSLGEAIATLHALPTDDLDGVDADWPTFVAKHRASARQRHVDKGLAERWADQLDAFVERWFVDDARRALLHTEIMRQHVLAERTEDGWRLSGLVDFEPSMVALPDYELASVGVFTTCGEPGLLAAYLEGYGAAWDASVPNRIMVQAILHRYGNLRWYLERLGDDGADTLELLAAKWFRP